MVLKYEAEIIDYVRGLTEAEKADLVSAYRALGQAIEKGDAPVEWYRYPHEMNSHDGIEFFPSAPLVSEMPDAKVGETDGE